MISADKHAFEGFGVLYYPIYETEAELFDGAAPTDADMTAAMTCVANMMNTGFTLTPSSVQALACYFSRIRTSVQNKAVQVAALVDPGRDIRFLVPTVRTSPMYPRFPQQVMEISEAQFRYDQLRHYASTYGVESVAAAFGMPATVGRGWLPEGGGQPIDNGNGDAVDAAVATPTADAAAAKPTADTTRSPKTPFDGNKLLTVMFSEESMRTLVCERLERPTRMHPGEIHCAVRALKDVPAESMPRIAFHENMLEIIRYAADGSAENLRSALRKTVQHPGDVLKAVSHTIRASRLRRLATRQKKAFCDVLGSFPYTSVVSNIADAHPGERRALNYLSVERFGNDTLKRAVKAVECGEVRSWNARVEQAWERMATDGPAQLIDTYMERPGVFLRSLTRLVKGGVPTETLIEAAGRSNAYSLASIVRTLTLMDARDITPGRNWHGVTELSEERKAKRVRLQQKAYQQAAVVLEAMLGQRLTKMDTPLRDKRVFVDAGPFSLAGSVLLPNDTGDTGTAYPPVGMAYSIPQEGRVRFFTFWNDRSKRVDVDVHFRGREVYGEPVDIGWNTDFRNHSMVFSGDITHSDNAVEYLDIDMKAAREQYVDHVMQRIHIFSGAASWSDINTCYSGAMVVDEATGEKTIYQGENLLFRDDMTGAGREMDYAMVDVQEGYVRLLRGANPMFVRTNFTLGTFIDMLLDCQGAERVSARDEADVVLSVGRTDDESAICLIDEGFFLK